MTPQSGADSSSRARLAGPSRDRKGAGPCTLVRCADMPDAVVNGRARTVRRGHTLREPGGGCVGMYVAALVVVLFMAQPHETAGAVDDSTYVVVKAGRVITVSGEEYAPGVVVIEDGQVSLVGDSSVEYPPAAKVVEARRETVMPGFVLPRSRYGLGEYDRSGVHGDWNAASEVYLEGLDFKDLLEAGYTTVCFVPDGKGIVGLGAAFRTAGPEEARRLGESAYIDGVIYWDSANKGKQVLRDALKKAKDEIEKVEKARKEWEEKQKAAQEEDKKKETPNDNGEDEPTPKAAENDNANENGEEEVGDQKEAKKPEEAEFKPPSIDPKYQPLVDLIQRKEGVVMMVRLGGASDALHLDDVLKLYQNPPADTEGEKAGLAHTFLLDEWGMSTDFEPVVEQLGKRKAQVALKPLINLLPYTTFRYSLMARLAASGCEVSVLPRNDSRIEYLRVRERLGEQIRAGLPREAALKSLTLYPARLLGLEKKLGTIEKGKDADLVFFAGDPLDPHVEVSRVMVLGEIVWERG